MKNSLNLEAIVDSLPIILFQFDPSGIIQYIGGNELGSNKPNDLRVGESVYNFAEADPVLIDLLDRAVKGDSFSSTLVISGAIWDIRFVPMFNSEHELETVTGMMMDITQSKQTEINNEQLFHALKTSHEKLQLISKRLFEIQEFERKRIAFELHDQIGQSLTGLQLAIELAIRESKDPQNPRLEEAKTLSKEVLELVRQMSLELRPAMLDDLGLLETLDWYFSRYKKQSNVQVIFSETISENRLNTQVETAIYRIIQEALNNVAKHAGVEEVMVSLKQDKLGVLLEISDQGKGFEFEENFRNLNSSGLASIQDRVSLLNGSLAIWSEPGRGTKIQVLFPVGVYSL